MRAKITLCIEVVYVVAQYFFNVFKFESFQDYERKEEWTILVGLGTEQQLGYLDDMDEKDHGSIFDSLYPFNFSVLFLLLIAIFTRYMGKPSFSTISKEGSERRKEKRQDGKELTENSSERRALTSRGGEDLLTVLNDESVGDEDNSDIRSQRSWRS